MKNSHPRLGAALAVAATLVLGVGLTSPVSAAAVTGASSTGSDIVVILGQSNAQGAGLPIDPALDGPVAGLDQLAGSGSAKGSVVPASNSLFQVTHWVTKSGGAMVGPGVEFGRELLKTEPAGRRVLLVPAAQGATSMAGDASYSWDPANTTARVNLYRRALTQIDLALSLNPNNRLVAVIWAQGESDATRSTGNEYRTRLLSLIDGLRARYGRVPFLIGGMVPEWIGVNPLRRAIDQAQQSIPSSRALVSFVPGVQHHNQDSLIHFDARGARMMGDRYFSVYMRLTSGAR